MTVNFRVCWVDAQCPPTIERTDDAPDGWEVFRSWSEAKEAAVTRAQGGYSIARSVLSGCRKLRLRDVE